MMGKTEVPKEKSVSVPLHPSQISHGLTCDQTWAPMVRGW